MGVQVDFISSPDAFQEDGVTEWTWSVGNPNTYQSFSVAPSQANTGLCRIADVFYVRGNSAGMDVHILVELKTGGGSTGGLLNFFGIGAPSR